MLYSLLGSIHIPARTVARPPTHMLTRGGGLLAAAALAAVLLIIPQQSQSAAPAGLLAPVNGTAQLVQNVAADHTPTFIVTKGQKG